MSTATEFLPPPADAYRVAGATVYIYGRPEAPATIIQADEDGAIVREHDEQSEFWYPWDRLTSEPAPDLHFRIERESLDTGPEWNPWRVMGNRPDWSGDYLWAHFPSHAEAVAFAFSAGPELSHKEDR